MFQRYNAHGKFHRHSVRASHCWSYSWGLPSIRWTTLLSLSRWYHPGVVTLRGQARMQWVCSSQSGICLLD